MFTSQMYELLDMPSGCCWKPKMLYAMAHWRHSPRVLQPGLPADVSRASISLGSRNTVRVLAYGVSLSWFAPAPLK